MLPHRYVRHETAESLVKAFMDGKDAYEDVFGGVHSFDGWVRDVRRYGMWAFVRIFKGRGTIHWYANDRVSDKRLAHMLGHELGHISGRRHRNAVQEEYRADAYGDVAMEVTEMLRTRARRAPAARRRGKTSARTNRRASSRAKK